MFKKKKLIFISAAVVLGLIVATCICLAVFNGNNNNNGNSNHTHSFGEWKTTVEPTCSSTGIETRYCEKCDYSETQTLDALPHTIVIDNAIQATCTTDGKTEGKHCSVCNTVIVKQKTVNASHKYVKGSTNPMPKCTSAGTQYYRCSVCGKTKTETIQPLGHDPDEFFICKRCKQSCPANVKLTSSEIAEAKKVHWISNREIDDLSEEKKFRLMFSLKDKNENYLKVPVVVYIEILNDKNDLVYRASRLVKTDDYLTWTNNFNKKWVAAAVYINYSDIDYGTSKNGTIYFEVYNDYVSFDTSTLTMDNLPLKPVTIILPTLPVTIRKYDYNKKISTSVMITNLTYTVKDDDLYLYFTGEKLYDIEGNGYSRSCRVGWKLYDSQGYIVKTGTFYSPNIATGEKFKDEK